MIWDLDKCEEAYQERRKTLVSSSPRLLSSSCETTVPLSLDQLLVSGKRVEVEVLPKSTDEAILQRAEKFGQRDFMSKRIAILDVKITNRDGSGIHIPSFHDQCGGSYGDYVKHISATVRNLRRRGHNISYRYYDPKLRRFVYENTVTLEDYPRNIGLSQRRISEKVVVGTPLPIPNYPQ